jgi:hypothetical protein
MLLATFEGIGELHRYAILMVTASRNRSVP